MDRLSKKTTNFSYTIKCLIWCSQMFGYAPFTYHRKKGKFIASKAWCLYAKLFTVTLSLLTVFYLKSNSDLIKVDKKFSIFYIVKGFDIYGNSLVMLISLFIQIYNRNKLIYTMNVAIVIKNNLRYLSPNEIIFAKSFLTNMRRFILILIIQATLFTWYCFESWKRITRTNIYFDFIII